jgi:GNAT superfamily N-acetyltransferase
MQLRSLFLNSEMIFWQFGSKVSDHGDYLVIQTPRNPTWRWGNLLIFPNPPTSFDFQDWDLKFESHLGRSVKYRLYVWETRTGEAGETALFTENGYTFSRQPLLSATRLIPPNPQAESYIYRVIRSDEDWDTARNLSCRCFANGDQGYELYLSTKFDLYREMVDAGLGFWMGAFNHDVLIASCGIFRNDRVTRYQEVVTDEDHRQQGIASTLVFEAFRHARSLRYPEMTLIAVDFDSQAERIYRKLGFEDCEITCALTKTLQA